LARPQYCEKRLLVSSCMPISLSLSLSVHMKQLSSHWTVFMKF